MGIRRSPVFVARESRKWGDVPDWLPRVRIAKLGRTRWDLAPDGKRVAVLTPMYTPGAPKKDHTVVFPQNFFDELRQRAPISK